MTIRVVWCVVISEYPSKFFILSSFMKCIVYYKSTNYLRTFDIENYASLELILLKLLRYDESFLNICMCRTFDYFIGLS